MITDADVTKLKKTFATKVEFNKLEKRMGNVEGRLDSVELKLDAVIEDLGDIKHTMGDVSRTLHNVVGMIDVLQQENRFGAEILNRHERQIVALAQHTGATLPE
jgi:hypothetical protein